MSEDWTKRIFTDVPRGTTPPTGAEAIDSEFLNAIQDSVIAKLNAGEADLRYTNEDDLVSTADAAKGDALVGLSQPYTGALGRTLHAKMTEFISVDDFSSWQAALDAAQPHQIVRVPAVSAGYRTLSASVNIPASTHLLLESEVRLATDVVINLDASGAKLSGGSVTYTTSGPTGSTGHAVRIGDDNCEVAGVAFSGTTRTAAIMIQNAQDASVAGTINGGGVRNCTFSATAYGILKQSANTTANRFKVNGNYIKDVVGGDGISWNLGSSEGTLISGNIIDNIARGSVANAGMGISLGGTDYTGAESANHRHISVVGNVISRCGEGIHAERCSSFHIGDNEISQVSVTTELSGAGIQIWGCHGFSVIGNEVSLAVYGVRTGVGGGVDCSDYLVSSNHYRDVTTHEQLTGTPLRPQRIFYGTEPLGVMREVGDLTIDSTSGSRRAWLTTSEGSQQLASTSHFARGVAGNDYITDTVGDSTLVFKPGMKISIAGLGTAGGALVATIRRMYVESSEFRIQLSKPVETTQATGQLITPSPLGVHRPLLIGESMSADRGDADVTLTLSDATIQQFATPLTVNRTVTFPATGYNGASFTIRRAVGATGASTLSVGGLKNLAAGQWADAVHDGTGWKLTRAGTL